MPSDKAARRLQDIVDAAGDIAGFIGGMDETAFRKDLKTIRAVERSIEIVLEAAAKLGDDVRARLGDHP